MKLSTRSLRTGSLRTHSLGKLSTIAAALSTALVFASSQVQAIGQNTLLVTQDSYVHHSANSTNFGNEATLLVKLSTSGSGDRQAYYQFDLSTLSDDVKSATFQVGIESANQAQLSIYSSAESWSETSIDWDSKLAALELVVSLPDDINGNYLTADIAAVINSYRAAGNQQLTLIIDAVEQTSATLKLSSSETSINGAQPHISFEYSNAEHGFTLGSHYVTAKDDPTDAYYNYAGDYLVAVAGEASELSQYGGWLGWNLGATGYFRTEKVNGNWTAVDPDGYAYIVMALNTVFNSDKLNLPGDIQAFGINAIGSWSDEAIENISYTPRWNFIAEFKSTDDTLKYNYNTDGIRIMPVFEPDFVTFADEWAKAAAAYKDDPYVFGHFTDNEIPFHQEIQLNSSLTYLDSDDPQYVSANSWMTEKYGNDYALDDITAADEHEYMGIVADKYYQVVTEALRKYDANHLILGTRLHAKSKYNEYVFAAAGKYTDIVSVNYYKNWQPELADAVTMWQEQAGIPFMVTEFYTKAADSGLDNSGGAGWQVLNQQGRSDFFENFALKLLSAPNNIGWHWFKFNDDDGSNKGAFTEDLTQPYQLLQDSMAQIASQVYPLRSVLLTGTADFDGEADTVETIPTEPTPTLDCSVPVAITASANDGNLSENIADGSIDTRWSANGIGQWLSLDCGVSTTISAANIAFYKGDQRQIYFTLQASDDGSTWSDVTAALTSSGDSLQQSVYSFSEVTTARYFRFFGNGNSANSWNSITEMNMLSAEQTSPTPSEVQLEVAAVSASADDGNGPIQTLDGNLATRWSANGDGQWIRYDLGASQALTQVLLAWYKGDQRSSDFSIDISDDDSNWQTIYSASSTGESSVLEAIDVSGQVARYVRITGYGNSSNSWNSLSEIEIYGLQ